MHVGGDEECRGAPVPVPAPHGSVGLIMVGWLRTSYIVVELELTRTNQYRIGNSWGNSAR